jgi:AmmeMemoRadiSam system protein B
MFLLDVFTDVFTPQVKRIFILGPSHHVRLSGCAISACSKYSTPFYNLTVDRGVNDELVFIL